MQPAGAPGMARLVWAAGLLWAAVASGSPSGKADVSLEEVRGTLQHLARSVEDEGRDAEALAERRREWCVSTLRAQATAARAAEAAAAQPHKVLSHDEPAAARLEGEVQGLQAQLVAAGNGTKQGPLGEQLAAALPKLAMLREAVANARAEETDTVTSVDALPAYEAALRESCSRGMERDRSQAAARLAALEALQPALSAIAEPMGLMQRGSSRHRMRVSGPHTAELERDAAMLADDGVTGDAMPQEVAPDQAPEPTQQISSQDSAKLRSLLSQLRIQKKSGTAARRAWCAREKPRALRALQLAQAAAKRVATIMDAHATEEKRLAQDLARLDGEAADMKAAVVKVRDLSSQEQAILAGVQDDRRIALKILGEASSVLSNLEGEVSLPAGIGKGASGAAALLKSASETFFAQIASAGAAQQEAVAAADQVAKTATGAAQAMTSERADVELAYDRQASQRAELVADRRAREQEAQEAAKYLDGLKGECGHETTNEVSGEARDVQLRALEDARQVLVGAKPAGAKVPPRKLTPMERAAERMGVLES